MQSLNGNCMTLEVTEMPRCCSSRIQSEVAWRAALRPLTVPASWIAPPNSSSFSVSVVLPASGCEMMAKVRRRATSSLVEVIGRDRSVAEWAAILAGRRGVPSAREVQLQHQRVLAPVAGSLVVALAQSHLDETDRLVERDGVPVRRA